MAQSGFTPIQLYYSTTASAVPTAGNLASGELALNIADGKLFYKDSGGVVQLLAQSGTSGVTSISFGTTGLTPSTTTTGAIIVAGTLVATNGGTGQSSYTVGDLLFASTTTALSKLADVATGNALISGGVGVAPSWGKIGLTTHITGTLATGNGGTGLTTFTAANNAIYSTSSSALTAGTLPVAAGGTGQTSYTNGQLLIGNSTGNTLTKATLTAGSGITITNGNGSITIASTAGGGTVTSVTGTGSYGGLTLSGTVTTSGNITLGGTPTGTWPISVSGNAGTATTLQTARTLWGQSFNGSANITAPLLPNAGSVSAPAFSTAADTNTGIFFPAADNMAFGTNGTEVIRIDSASNVGIGTSSPLCKLQVSGAIAGGYGTMTSIQTACDFATRNVVKKTISTSAQTVTTTVPPEGTICVLQISKGTTNNDVLTLGTGFVSTGTISTGTDLSKRFNVTFVSDGVSLWEISRNGPV